MIINKELLPKSLIGVSEALAGYSKHKINSEGRRKWGGERKPRVVLVIRTRVVFTVWSRTHAPFIVGISGSHHLHFDDVGFCCKGPLDDRKWTSEATDSSKICCYTGVHYTQRCTLGYTVHK